MDNAFGGSGDDTLNGNALNNWLAGGPGSDTFNGGDGNDVLLIDAEDLQAHIHGGAGLDIVQVMGDAGVTLNLAQAEVEVAQGGRGADIFVGGGRSTVYIRGGGGEDIIIGGAANDALSGEDGADLIDGGQGNDVIRGDRGKDVLLGGLGQDVIHGGLDDDRLAGGADSDWLAGGWGDDAIDGGEGVDIVKFAGSYGDYRFTRVDESTWWVSDSVSAHEGYKNRTGAPVGKRPTRGHALALGIVGGRCLRGFTTYKRAKDPPLSGSTALRGEGLLNLQHSALHSHAIVRALSQTMPDVSCPIHPFRNRADDISLAWRWSDVAAPTSLSCFSYRPQ